MSNRLRKVKNELRSVVKLGALLCAATALAACSTPGSKLVGKIMPVNPTPADQNATSRVIFSNTTNPEQTSTVMVSSDGRVISGLQSQQLTVVPVCEGFQTFQITQGGTAAVQVEVNAKPNEVYYVKLSPQQSPFQIDSNITRHANVDEAVQGQKARSYLVPRFQPNCAEPEKPIATFNLNADALFKFDGSTLSDIVDHQPLNDVTHFIKEHADLAMRVSVSGYTDQLGSRNYNQKLSEARAETVAHYLQNYGYDGSMQVFGFGPNEPVVNCSSDLTGNALIQCLQPNRRVTVRIWQDK